MRGLKTACVVAAFAVLTACQSTSPHDELADQGATKLDTDRIQTAFSGKRESYTAMDGSNVSATAIYGADGAFESNWSASGNSGTITGTWFAENDMRCIEFENTGGLNLPERECIEVWQTADNVYVSVNPDGSYHGEHTLTPL